MHHDSATIIDIVEASKFIRKFIQGMTKKTFLKDVKTQSAVLHQLMVIGEAVKRLSSSFCKEHPKIPWSLIAGMRDKLIHAYDVVDFDEVWKTAKKDIPALYKYLSPLLPSSSP